MRVALKVDVDTLRGTLEGVPALLRLFRRCGVTATFLFSLGPDHTGRALRRVLRPGFLQKVRRTSVTSHYGIRTLLYGTLLPGPDIGRRGAAAMREAAAAGHQVGVHCYDHVTWQDLVARRDAAWTRRQMELAVSAFHSVFGEPPEVHGAAGWQMNTHALALEPELGFRYASDTRGREPFRAIWGDSKVGCPQIPTTLPTLDELLGRGGIDDGNVADALFRCSLEPLPQGHVYTLHAELEGMRLLPVLQRLLERWQAEGFAVVPLAEVYRAIEPERLPRRPVAWGEVPGRSGRLLIEQGFQAPDAASATR